MKLFHSTQTAGITLFIPKKYWHLPDHMRSGIIGNDTVIPEGAEVSLLFFAANHEMAPVFFTDKNIFKYAVLGGTTTELMRRHNIEINNNQSAILFDSKDEGIIRSQAISVYEFDSSHFRLVSSGEYVTNDPVRPTHETRMSSCYEAMCNFGFAIHFVCDLEDELRPRQNIQPSNGAVGLPPEHS